MDQLSVVFSAQRPVLRWYRVSSRRLGDFPFGAVFALAWDPMTRPGCYEIPVRGADQRGAQVVRILGGEGRRADSMIAAIYERLIEQAKRALPRLER